MAAPYFVKDKLASKFPWTSWMFFFIILLELFMVIVYLMQNHGFKCIAKEADLTCELLRLEAPIDDYLITQGTVIR